MSSARFRYSFQPSRAQHPSLCTSHPLPSPPCNFHIVTVHPFAFFSDKTPMNSLYGLLDLSLLWFVFVSGSLVHFLWIFGRQLFIVFNTQVTFTITTMWQQSVSGRFSATITYFGSVAALGSLFSDRFPMCSSSIVFSVRVIVCLFSLLFC